MNVWQHYKLSRHYLSRYQAMAQISRAGGLTKTQRYDYASLFAKHLEHWHQTLVTIEWPCPECKYDNETSYSLFGRHIERPTCEQCGANFSWVTVLEASCRSWVTNMGICNAESIFSNVASGYPERVNSPSHASYFYGWAVEAYEKATEVSRILEIERKRTASYEEME